MYNFEFTVKTSMEGQDVQNICNTIASVVKNYNICAINRTNSYIKTEGINTIGEVANNLVNSGVQLIKSGVLERFLPKKYVPAVCFLKEIVRKAEEQVAEEQGTEPDAQPTSEPENGTEATK